MAAKAANRPFFDGDQRLVMAGELVDQICIQGFGKTRVSNRGRDPFLGQNLRSFAHFFQAGAKVQESHAIAVCDHPPLADFKRLTACR